MQRGLFRAIIPVIAAAVSGCDPQALSDNGVIGVFGGLGRGPGSFYYPRAIAAEPNGSIFVVDKTGRVQRYSAEGRFETVWTMPETAQGKPVGLAVHPDGRIFVADTHYHRVLIFDRDGTLLGGFGASVGRGVTSSDSPGGLASVDNRRGETTSSDNPRGLKSAARNGDAELQLPTAVAFDADGFIYVSEYHGNDRITKWSPELRFLKAFGEEPIDGLRLSRPSGLAITAPCNGDEAQTLWVADACNHRLVGFTLDGRVLKTIGTFGRRPGEMRYPYDVRLTPDGMLLVCEYEGTRLQWFSTDGRSLRLWGRPGRQPGELFAPWGATYGPGGRVYVVDSLNNRVQIMMP